MAFIGSLPPVSIKDGTSPLWVTIKLLLITTTAPLPFLYEKVTVSTGTVLKNSDLYGVYFNVPSGNCSMTPYLGGSTIVIGVAGGSGKLFGSMILGV